MYKILLVDDEELERKILSFILQNSCLSIKIVGEAASGREALEKVHLTHPDLIIMDIKMPGIDGIEATRQIKALYPTIEVIILTAYSKFSYSQQAIKAQATDYLLKPIQPQQLIEAVQLAFDRLSHKNSQACPAIDLLTQGQVLVRKAMDYIESNYGNNISLNMVATHVHLSPAYLSRIFNKKTGGSLTDYLAQVRLRKAKQQLRMSTATIDQIAAATGFNSSSYFSAIFKKNEGITPSAYRANLSLNNTVVKESEE